MIPYSWHGDVLNSVSQKYGPPTVDWTADYGLGVKHALSISSHN